MAQNNFVWLSLLFAIIFLQGIVCSVPEQIHVSLGAYESSYVVTWTTYNGCNNESKLVFGFRPDSLTSSAEAVCTLFVDGGLAARRHYIYRAVLVGLDPSTRYYYQCVNGPERSDTLYLTTTGFGSDWSPRLLVYGDLGLINGQSVPRIREQVNKGKVDAILHIGDFAYDLHTEDSLFGDAFMNYIQPFASKVPYQTCAGNHEQAYNFSNYNNRFTMFDMNSKKLNNHYYTFHLGPAQFIMINTEFYYYYFKSTYLRDQYEWLKQTLAQANLPENRARWPWLITLGHRPMYCSNTDHDDCTKEKDKIRTGMDDDGQYALEELFNYYGVDIEFWAHEHSYERLWPVYNNKVYSSPDEDPYTNPSAPIHIVTGSAGCQEFIDDFVANPQKWSAKRVSDYGYTQVNILNGTHIELKQISDKQNGTILDQILIVQEKHGIRSYIPLP